MSSVLPGVEDVFASLRLFVSILIKLDLPTLDRPMKAYSGFVSFGHMDTIGADNEKSACLISITISFLGCKSNKKIWKSLAISEKIRNFASEIQKTCFRPRSILS